MAEQVQAAMDQMVEPLRDLLDRNIFTTKEIQSIVICWLVWHDDANGNMVSGN